MPMPRTRKPSALIQELNRTISILDSAGPLAKPAAAREVIRAMCDVLRDSVDRLDAMSAEIQAQLGKGIVL